MGNTLKPGGMGPTTPDNAKPADFADSMADAIEQELSAILIAEGRDGIDANTNTQDARDRRLLLVAIARGVVRHLKENQDAFTLNATVTGSGDPVGGTVKINTV